MHSHPDAADSVREGERERGSHTGAAHADWRSCVPAKQESERDEKENTGSEKQTAAAAAVLLPDIMTTHTDWLASG